MLVGLEALGLVLPELGHVHEGLRVCSGVLALRLHLGREGCVRELDLGHQGRVDVSSHILKTI